LPEDQVSHPHKTTAKIKSSVYFSPSVIRQWMDIWNILSWRQEPFRDQCLGGYRAPWAVFLGTKQAGREADLLPPPAAQV
jgi:hypothetical protein